MIIEFPIEDSVRKRSSVRNFSDRQIEPEKVEAIGRFVKALDNPFGKEVRFHFFAADDLAAQLSSVPHDAPSANPQRIGTYGVIKGASHFIGASIKKEPMALEALGYEMEALILYLASLELGSCWLGGTFDRKGFVEAMEIDEERLLPAITPYGYAAQRKHFKESMMRRLVGAEKRKPWQQLFFHNDFDTALTEQSAGELTLPLEMVRLGPSASNKQPWRVLLKDEELHFFEDKSPGYSAAFSYDIQRIDLGIAAAHLELSARERGITGRFETDGDVELGLDEEAAKGAAGEAGSKLTEKSNLRLPDHYEYVFSWRRK